MAVVAVRLRTVLPRWLLTVDPYVRVSGEPPKRPTKVPVEFEVPTGSVQVDAAMFRTDLSATDPGLKGIITRSFWRTPISTFVANLAEDEVLRLSFHKVGFSALWIRGRFRRE